MMMMITKVTTFCCSKVLATATRTTAMTRMASSTARMKFGSNSKNERAKSMQCWWFSSSSSCFSTTTTSSSSSIPSVVHVSIEEAQSMTTRALEQLGWDHADASLQAEIMVAAELCGNNQGLVKMYQPQLMAPSYSKQPPEGTSTTDTTPLQLRPTIERETETSAVINANQAPGMIAACMAADLASQKAKPISIVTSYNTSTSSGQLAYYVERMAKRNGVIGIAMANSPELVAAAPGGKAVFGTNPLAVAVPVAGQDEPFTFDMATSAIALFGVLSAQAKGEPLPPNVAYGKDGNWTTNAQEALTGGGAIATFGGHKGAGLSLCVELLAGALSGSAVLGQVESKKVAKNWGHLFIAIQPKDYMVDQYDDKVASILHAVKESGPNIRLPGERSVQTARQRREAGVIPIPERIWQSIVHTAQHGIVTK